MSKPSIETFQGCLLGCAVGDALGAPFEGLWGSTIPIKEELLSGYAEFEGYPRGQFTDDTQLSIATVESIVEQGQVSPHDIACRISELWKSQAVVGPGGACTRAADQFLATGNWQTCGAPVGQAGNGTAMRTAVLGLFYHSIPEELPQSAADISRITHSDPRSIAGGVAIAKASQLLATGKHPSSEFFAEVADSMMPYEPQFARLVQNIPKLATKDSALDEIAWAGMESAEFSEPIITPFVMPTVIAALWILARFPDCWSSSVAAVIGLGGDVDTLGAIVGALQGAHLGIDAIPSHLREQVFEHDRLTILANRYHAVVKD
ncbi:MAG: hypothetical protein COA78_11630 [Blastopirellula sp.]|nr:MAG: hypothetical protein COA78_11630 [Blastopirellula sp.]